MINLYYKKTQNLRRYFNLSLCFMLFEKIHTIIWAKPVLESSLSKEGKPLDKQGEWLPESLILIHSITSSPHFGNS